MKKFFILLSVIVTLLVSCSMFTVDVRDFFDNLQENANTGTSTPPTGGNLTSPTVGTMVAITGGSFARDNDGTDPGTATTDITVSDFYLGETEVTQGQWEAVMGSNPSSFSGSENLPVEYVTWYEAIAFCNALSADEGLDAYFAIDKTNQDPNNTSTSDTLKWTVTVNAGSNGYRLPTEAEWEYAAGGGSGSRTMYAAPITSDTTTEGIDDTSGAKLTDYAWYSANAGSKTHIVGTAGSAKPDEAKSGNKNALELYDMSGNVWEWCWDWYGNYDTSVTNPTGPATGAGRVNRGGSWYDNASYCRVAYRSYSAPGNLGSSLGLRVARSK